jgi:hypothetical protein
MRLIPRGKWKDAKRDALRFRRNSYIVDPSREEQANRQCSFKLTTYPRMDFATEALD